MKTLIKNYRGEQLRFAEIHPLPANAPTNPLTAEEYEAASPRPTGSNESVEVIDDLEARLLTYRLLNNGGEVSEFSSGGYRIYLPALIPA